jgi:hypothetical protein
MADSSAALDAALDDLLAAFAALNRDLNGDVPSASSDPGGELPVRVAYAVSEIGRMLRKAIPALPSANRAAWVVDTAWNAVLAGDVDDLDEYVALEGAASDSAQ